MYVGWPLLSNCHHGTPFPSVACLLSLLAVVFGEQKFSSELKLLGHFFHVLNLPSCKEPSRPYPSSSRSLLLPCAFLGSYILISCLGSVLVFVKIVSSTSRVIICGCPVVVPASLVNSLCLSIVLPWLFCQNSSFRWTVSKLSVLFLWHVCERSHRYHAVLTSSISH